MIFYSDKAGSKPAFFYCILFMFKINPKYFFHDQPEYRIGDEIQTTAIIKYFKTKNYKFYYKDSNRYVSALKLFPDNLVVFAAENWYNMPIFNPEIMWFWNPLMRKLGIFTELNIQYNESKADIDVVFIPVIAPNYNFDRGIKPESAIFFFELLNQKFAKAIMVVDKEKQHLIENLTTCKNIVYSDDIYDTFRYIQRSKIFVGGDTGTSHYAGALKHPRMILNMFDETAIKLKFRPCREYLAKKFNEPEIKNIDLDFIPCCNPNQYKISMIQNNEINISEIMSLITNC